MMELWKFCPRVQLGFKGGWFLIRLCKLVIYNYVFCWLLFRAKFDCNYVQSFISCISCEIYLWGLCVRERECVKTQGIEDWSVFAGSSWVSILRSDACALHMTRMRRVRTGWRQLVFASILRVRPSHETPAKYSVLLDCHFWYTLFVPTLFILTLPTDVEEFFWEKTLATNLES